MCVSVCGAYECAGTYKGRKKGEGENWVKESHFLGILNTQQQSLMLNVKATDTCMSDGVSTLL